jgi:amino acid adenylation domain-containing protein
LNKSYQQQQIKNRCFHPSQTFVEFKKAEVEQSAGARFEQQVCQYPEQIAVKTERRELTYTELNQVANHIARAILARRGPGAEPVVLLLGNDILMIAAMLGVLKTGKFYIPLDPHYLLPRIAYILEDSQAPLIVTDAKHLPLAQQVAQAQYQLLNLDEVSPSPKKDWERGPGGEGLLNSPVSPDDIAYIIYTSGSTGQPKGIVHTHRNLLHNTSNYTNNWHICQHDRLTLLHSCSFSSGVVDIFCALFNGARLYPWDFKAQGVTHLADWLSQEEITIFSWAPSPFRHFINTLTGGPTFPQLRLVALGSEPLLKKDVESYQKHFSSTCILVNRLGATEVNNICLYFIDKESQLEDERVPAGYLVEGKELLLLDEKGNQVGLNCLGEIAVRSRYISPGYWQKPELTAKVFLPDPEGGDKRIYLTGDLGLLHPDGCLEYFGRKDFQVKIRGHRIEVSEIETTLLKHEAIKEAAVVASPDASGEMRLIAYIVLHEKQAASASSLYHFLKERLPEYMLPASFVSLDSLPLSPNGKLDRLALTSYDQGQTLPLNETFLAPRSPLEEKLASLWTDVLKIKVVGVHDSFFELGGHSLLAMQLISRIRDVFGIQVSLKSFLEKPTIAELSLAIEQNQTNGVQPKTAMIKPIARRAYRM